MMDNTGDEMKVMCVYPSHSKFSFSDIYPCNKVLVWPIDLWQTTLNCFPMVNLIKQTVLCLSSIKLTIKSLKTEQICHTKRPQNTVKPQVTSALIHSSTLSVEEANSGVIKFMASHFYGGKRTEKQRQNWLAYRQ